MRMTLSRLAINGRVHLHCLKVPCWPSSLYFGIAFHNAAATAALANIENAMWTRVKTTRGLLCGDLTEKNFEIDMENKNSHSTSSIGSSVYVNTSANCTWERQRRKAINQIQVESRNSHRHRCAAIQLSSVCLPNKTKLSFAIYSNSNFSFEYQLACCARTRKI